MFQIKTPQWRQRSCVNYSPCPRGGRVHGGAEQQIWHLLVQLTGHNTPRPLPPSPSAASNGQTQIFSYLNCSERLPIMKNNKTTEPAAIQMLLVPGRKTISGTICWREQRIQSAQSVAEPPLSSSYIACHMKEAREQNEKFYTIKPNI